MALSRKQTPTRFKKNVISRCTPPISPQFLFFTAVLTLALYKYKAEENGLALQRKMFVYVIVVRKFENRPKFLNSEVRIKTMAKNITNQRGKMANYKRAALSGIVLWGTAAGPSFFPRNKIESLMYTDDTTSFAQAKCSASGSDFLGHYCCVLPSLFHRRKSVPSRCSKSVHIASS